MKNSIDSSDPSFRSPIEQEASKLYSLYYKAIYFYWNYRIQNELAIASERAWHATWYTFTFRDEKEATYENWKYYMATCRRRVKALRKAHNQSLAENLLRLAADGIKTTISERFLDEHHSPFRYICISERGSKTGRIHYHAIFLHQIYMP